MDFQKKSIQKSGYRLSVCTQHETLLLHGAWRELILVNEQCQHVRQSKALNNNNNNNSGFNTALKNWFKHKIMLETPSNPAVCKTVEHTSFCKKHCLCCCAVHLLCSMSTLEARAVVHSFCCQIKNRFSVVVVLLSHSSHTISAWHNC